MRRKEKFVEYVWLRGIFKMKCVEIKEGLGNQMFQYAFLMSLKKKYPNTIILTDTSFYLKIWKNPKHAKYFLKKIFNLDRTNIILSLFIRIFRSAFYKIDMNKILIYKPISHSTILKGSVYFSGYWQSEKYFESIQDKVRKVFKFKEPKSPHVITILNDIRESEAVSIHVRRGDYLSNNHVYRNLNEDGFYEKAISLINERIPNAKFFVFSDDSEWCEQIFTEENSCVVDCNTGDNSYLDMFLMTQCKHNIIANSSFSWWGAWLNEHQDKIVISPKEWFATNSIENCMDDILPEDWIRI